MYDCQRLCDVDKIGRRLYIYHSDGVARQLGAWCLGMATWIESMLDFSGCVTVLTQPVFPWLIFLLAFV
jgi:hypothetical protein